MSDPSCRVYRELLGVYVVGAIDPAERAMIEAHLSQCAACREELAGLALLPTLMHRVPPEEAEQIARSNPAEAGPVSPSPELLSSLLRRVSAKRTARRVRSAFTVAAAVVIAAGGGAAAVISQSASPPVPVAAHLEVATASKGDLEATVRYGKARWGTSMSVRVTGFRPGSWCELYVISKGGVRALTAAWTLGPGRDRMWYPVRAGVPTSQVTGFVITAAGNQLRIPAP